MSAKSKPIATKKAADIQPGDRICYKSHQVRYWQRYYTNGYTELSGEVISVQISDEGKYEFLTSSSWLQPVSATAEFELVSSDYEKAVQTQYDVKPAEVYVGVSIE
jgi:hypothetical protein